MIKKPCCVSVKLDSNQLVIKSLQKSDFYDIWFGEHALVSAQISVLIVCCIVARTQPSPNIVATAVLQVKNRKTSIILDFLVLMFKSDAVCSLYFAMKKIGNSGRWNRQPPVVRLCMRWFYKLANLSSRLNLTGTNWAQWNCSLFANPCANKSKKIWPIHITCIVYKWIRSNRIASYRTIAASLWRPKFLIKQLLCSIAFFWHNFILSVFICNHLRYCCVCVRFFLLKYDLHFQFDCAFGLQYFAARKNVPQTAVC